MSRNIIGFVDNFHFFDTLGGWAKCSDDESALPITVVVYEGETEIGRGQTSIMRGDDTRCGFSVRLTRELDIADLTSGRIRVFGEYEGARGELRCIASMLAGFEALCIGRRIAGGGDALARNLVDGLTVNASSRYLQLLRGAWEASRRGERAEMLDGVAGLQGSPFLLPVGLKSADGAAVIGHGGHIFILGGSNNLIAAYDRDRMDPRVRSTAATWLDVFRARSRRLPALGCRYVQVNIPDKSSVIPEHFPVPLQAPTALFGLIEEGKREDAAVAAASLGVLDRFRADPRRDALFQKTDSHLSAYGCQRLMLDILGHLGCEAGLATGLGRRLERSGDLGLKYIGAAPLEVLELPEEGAFAAFERGLEQVERYAPPHGGNGGARLVWRNATAPLGLRVVAFANSFFGYGDMAVGLSWWASRCFREFHFIWDANVDDDYVRRVRPDVVIGQSVERFMIEVAEA